MFSTTIYFWADGEMHALNTPWRGDGSSMQDRFLDKPAVDTMYEEASLRYGSFSKGIGWIPCLHGVKGLPPGFRAALLLEGIS